MNDYRSYCRTCMSDSGEFVFDVFATFLDSNNVADFISSITNIQSINSSDNLPKQICECCYKKLSDFHEYKKQIESADKKLREIYEKINLDTVSKICIKTEQDDAIDDDHDYEDVLIDLKLEPNSNLKHDDADDDDVCIDSIPENTNLKNLLCKTECKKPKIKIENHPSKPQGNHKSSRRKRTNFQCELCSIVFRKLELLKEHYRTEHEDYQYLKPKPKFICDICQREFPKRYRIERHMTVHSEKPTPYGCLLCTESFHRRYQLTEHVINNHGLKTKIKTEIKENNDLTCDSCPSTFDTKYALAAHKRKHTKTGRILACSICGKVFKKLSHLKRHELTHEENRPFKCHVCPKSFHIEENLQDHLSKHSDVNGVMKHVCPICSKEVGCKSTLTSHLKLHTGEKPHLCQLCGKKFDSSNNLKQHMRRHNGEKPFGCEMCPKRFVSKGELKSHYVSHTGEKAWTCDQCGSLFSKSSTLKKHKMTHLGIKPHECDICPMKFVSKDHLKRHYRIHTGEKPYKCDICERAFTQTTDLVKHKRSHLGSKVYKCDQCSECFRLKSELTKHLSKHYVESLKKDVPPSVLTEYNAQVDK